MFALDVLLQMSALDDTCVEDADSNSVTGSDVLPRLFGASLPLTMVAAPAASAFLGRSSVSRDRAVHQLYRILAASIVGEQPHDDVKSM